MGRHGSAARVGEKKVPVLPDRLTARLERVEATAALPGGESSATYRGLNGFPVVDDVVMEDFRT